jgi:hypothetical protein
MSSPSNAREPDRFDAFYFSSGNYADRRLGAFSMYWFARRYYAALIRRHAPGVGGALLSVVGWAICSGCCKTTSAASASM